VSGKAAVIVALLLCSGISLRAQPAETESAFKAVYLYNFLQFVEWPQPADSTAPLVVGVLGRDPIEGQIHETMEGETIKARKLEIHRVARLSDLVTCQAVFIARSEGESLDHVLRNIPRGCLTVSDIDGFIDHGGMIGFRVDDGKLRFDINEKAARAAGLQLSSQLLRLARVVLQNDSP
jgi:hypothetical protein